MTSIAEAEKIVRQGAAALQSGNLQSAREAFRQVTRTGMANAQIWLLLAHTAAQLRDWAEVEQASDAVLARDGSNLRALVLKGDARDGLGDARGASSFYLKATRLAEATQGIPADLAAEVRRGGERARAISSEFRRRLASRLDAAGLDAARRSRRFEESLGILSEEKQIYLQQPSAYYFPGLPQIQFYEREQFAWAAALEAAAGAIRTELDAALAGKDGFRPYLQSRIDRPSYDFHGLLDNPAWSTLYLWENGAATPGARDRFPQTFAALEQVPMPHITTRAPSILFSLLQPGARIEPHHGMINTRLICHLPLIVPPGCGFRVGNEVREWEVGKLLIFDDTIEHEAWNDSGEDRVVLIFDIWRPELDEGERRAVTTMFEAIDAG
ncbi:hypothetical protein J2W22_000062 [Sphingomonas kyeonggiensis]|uniref:aspartyl/asparaginyl beta-hydroxylase domain-containing protein n=1 Tax=Sphingomonas kyeonggiensis TaxID=1268553 RepID=UPI00277D9BDD|nr:aspartyl/asparaginyl beta-hydroxylase domain-containing protein [Sphingomonas kyeonggiensis]MDQ0248015.1 hypothetical protein [Sphingomonas kyeonggiensis]